MRNRRIAGIVRIASWLAPLALGALLAPPADAEAPSVVVSIPPVHALAAGVMAGIGTPDLLVRGGRSPHSAALRPSDIRRLQGADLIVWVGPGLETFLVRPLAALDEPRPAIVTLFEARGVSRRTLREGGAWESHDRPAHAHDVESGVSAKFIDPHIWLSPENAIAATERIADWLQRHDRTNAAAYAANAGRVTARIRALDDRLATVLAPVRRAPYVVFHDAYQYFERHFGLNPVGAVTLSPDRQIGAQRLSGIRAHMAKTGALCAFREPQFPPRLIETIVDDTPVRVGVLDPLGADIEPGPDHWFILMDKLAAALVQCLRLAN